MNPRLSEYEITQLLFDAIDKSNIEGVLKCIEESVDSVRLLNAGKPDDPRLIYRSPLLACFQSKLYKQDGLRAILPLLELLLKHKADVNGDADGQGRTLLMLACDAPRDIEGDIQRLSKGQYDFPLVNFLLEHGANPLLQMSVKQAEDDSVKLMTTREILFSQLRRIAQQLEKSYAADKKNYDKIL